MHQNSEAEAIQQMAANAASKTVEEQREQAVEARQQYSDGPGKPSPGPPVPPHVDAQGVPLVTVQETYPAPAFGGVGTVPPTTRAFASGLIAGIVVGGIAAMALRRSREISE